MGKFFINDVRGAFMEVFEPKAFNGEGKPAFSMACIIDPDTEVGKKNIARIEAEQKAVAIAKWGEGEVSVKTKTGTVKMPKWQAVFDEIEKNDKLALHDGDKKSAYDGYPGNVFVNLRNETRPLVIDRQRLPVTMADGLVYSGAYYNVQLELWAQDNSYGKRINATLKGVQYFRPGDAFAGGTPPAEADEFEDLSDDGEGSDLT